MKKVLVLGCSGAGKSTLSRILSKKLNLPLIHLDQAYWKPGWKEPNKKDWEEKVKQLIAEEEWIIDGSFSGTLDIRAEAADTLIYLDRNTFRCLYRVTKRTIQYWGKKRPDMVEGCHERFDLEFFHYILSYNLARKPSVFKKLKALKKDKQVFILNNRQTKKFLANI